MKPSQKNREELEKELEKEWAYYRQGEQGLNAGFSVMYTSSERINDLEQRLGKKKTPFPKSTKNKTFQS